MIDLIRYTSLKWPSSCCGLFIDILAMHSVLLSTTKMSSSIVSYLLTIKSLKHRKWDMTYHSWRMICTVFSLFSLLLHDCMFYEYERGLSFTVITVSLNSVYCMIDNSETWKLVVALGCARIWWGGGWK